MNDNKQVIFNLSIEQREKLNILAHKNYTSMSGYLRKIIENNYDECIKNGDDLK